MSLTVQSCAPSWSGFRDVESELDHEFANWSDVMQALVDGVLDPDHYEDVAADCARIADMGGTRPGRYETWSDFVAVDSLLEIYFTTSERLMPPRGECDPNDTIGHCLLRMGREADKVVEANS